jgi:hypothetical protein
VKVWREGEHLEVGLKLCTPKQLVPVHSHDVKPSYLIYAGQCRVMLVLTKEHVHSACCAQHMSTRLFTDAGMSLVVEHIMFEALASSLHFQRLCQQAA